MSSAGIQAGVLPVAAPWRWPCRPSAWASAGLIWFSSCCAPRKSSNGSHWVLCIIWFSPRAWAASAAWRLGDNAVQVRAAGGTCRASPGYGKQCSLSRASFRRVNMEGARVPLEQSPDHYQESHTLWFNAPLAEGNRRPPLTRERVVAEALTVIAQDGVSALTMRTLAVRLGVVPGALYRHVRNKEQLQDLVLDGVLAEVDCTLDRSLPWTQQLNVLAHRLREVLEGHPGVAGLLQLRDPLGPDSLAVAEAFLGPLQAAGFPNHEAGLAFFLVIDYTTGFAVSSPHISTNLQRVRDAATRTQLHQFFRSLPTDRSPALAILGEHVCVANRDQRFATGLDILIDGLERAQRAPQRRTPGRRPASTTGNTRAPQTPRQAVDREVAQHDGHRSHSDR